MVGLGKPKLCTKFEVASVSHCVNIERNRQILGSSPSPGPCLPFLLRVIFIMGFGKPQLRAKFKVVSPIRGINIIGEPQNFEELP